MSSINKARYFLLDQNAAYFKKMQTEKFSLAESQKIGSLKLPTTKRTEDTPKKELVSALPAQPALNRRDISQTSIYPSLEKKLGDLLNNKKETRYILYHQLNPESGNKIPVNHSSHGKISHLKEITADELSRRFQQKAFSSRLLESWKKLV